MKTWMIIMGPTLLTALLILGLALGTERVPFREILDRAERQQLCAAIEKLKVYARQEPRMSWHYGYDPYHYMRQEFHRYGCSDFAVKQEKTNG